jgi:hypothetical protein
VVRPCVDQSLTLDQATDLARHFLGGPSWYAWSVNGACLLGRGPGYIVEAISETSWREAFRKLGVKLPVRRHYAHVGPRVMREGEAVATAVSNSMAERIANALNSYTPDRRGT